MQPYSLVEPSTPVIFHIASLVLAAVVTGAPFKATDESTLAGPFRPWKDSRTDTPIHALPMPWQVAADSQTPLFPAPLETWTPTGVDLDNITDYVNVTYRSGSIFCDTTNGSPDLFEVELALTHIEQLHYGHILPPVVRQRNPLGSKCTNLLSDHYVDGGNLSLCGTFAWGVPASYLHGAGRAVLNLCQFNDRAGGRFYYGSTLWLAVH